MRWYQITALALLAFVTSGLLVASDEKKQDAQRFKVTFTITYNEATLSEAAELERVVREQHAKACAVVVGVESLTQVTCSVIYLNRYNNMLPVYRGAFNGDNSDSSYVWGQAGQSNEVK